MIAVGFDFDHTLGLDHGLERRALGALAAEFGSPIDTESPELRARIEGILQPFRRDAISMAEMVSSFVRAFAPAADRGATPEELADAFRRHCYALVPEVTAVDGARECIAELADAGVPLAILTNGWSPLQECKIAHVLGVFPGPILVSQTIGAYKPSTHAFRALETALGCRADELWYVGDTPASDVGGARAHGVRAVWFDWEGLRYPDDVVPPDAAIHHLSELPPLIRGAQRSAAKTSAQPDGHAQTHRGDAS